MCSFPPIEQKQVKAARSAGPGAGARALRQTAWRRLSIAEVDSFWSSERVVSLGGRKGKSDPEKRRKKFSCTFVIVLRVNSVGRVAAVFIRHRTASDFSM